jgi:L-serine dehydratase
MAKQLESILNVYRIGCGPSSSHTIGPERALRTFLKRCPTYPLKVRVTLLGSLAATGMGHGTDQVLRSVDPALAVEVISDCDTSPLPHPNTLRMSAWDKNGQEISSWEVWSVGGGNLEDQEGPVEAGPKVLYDFNSLGEALQICGKEKISFPDLVLRYEPGVMEELKTVWSTMEASVGHGLGPTEQFLPGPLKVRRRARSTYRGARKLSSPQRDLGLMSAYALAVAEENANNGRIVTAPTCGSSGVLPGILYYFRHERDTEESDILQALATAGLVGAIIRCQASISGAEVGCQGEIGSAASMAAAATAQIMGGSLAQIEYAAEIAMEHLLGLTCDPVEGYVQVPCIERNLVACLRAFESATYALLTDGKHLVTFDDVIAVMKQTGRDLQSAYRETARGGLAQLWRERRVQR